MFKKILPIILAFHAGVFAAAPNILNLDESERTTRTTTATTIPNCLAATSSLWYLGAAAMHATALYFTHEARDDFSGSENNVKHVRASLMAGMVGNGIAAGGSFISACCSPFSFEGAGACTTLTIAGGWFLANIPIWVAIGFEANTGADVVSSSLTTAAVLSGTAIVPMFAGLCQSMCAKAPIS